MECDASLLIGRKTTRGLGSGGDPEKGRAAAEESYSDIQRLLADADIIFLTCGLGGGTGTGAVPIIAQIAREVGAIVIGVVTLPFSIEGGRKERAYAGLEALRKNANTVVIIENDRLLKIAPNLPIKEAFSVADEVLASYIYSIISTVAQPSLINVDFADLRTIIGKGGVTLCGIGEATGKERAQLAVKKALESPLMDVDYHTGCAALIHVTGGSTMSLKEASSVVEIIQEKLNRDVEIIWGTKVDPELGDLLRVTVIISGVQSKQMIGMLEPRKASEHSLLKPSVVGKLPQSDFPAPSRAKENWLKRDFVPVFQDLKKRAKTNQETSQERSKNSPDKEPKDDFWAELGLEKGVK